ncbi:MAG: UDP-glucose/GDP-mannose dehydrogenase family protein [Clostridium sp.]|jgi:UDPglucose 6-dehydrogenase|uniref:UDP-glucose dehydrogenase family protein n=1 Tax=Clostridium sp. TaxID=1506 RepID=UPI0025B91B6F|nr:UDP-glucose/GDP-mannose dehydrogenase family protein [Clostridium sp.]MCH3964275.1 UDP-glucose/GDP-mannose dehydrogenase family protein [Clostridium sp.]MCI1715455.1 UDP-glucose/GDP-mannose dehydrogenase family protein [Clostridium sp.]MCI1799754.1 UDP-glucose/GDP-mannose dehydrogenase family protein [Clostridium sp.]MCI1813638.1 UDP-glucose/GDP-mannose dehydrogenase family protein [Clostridium sp.]MCI1870571.1 UDP-glucose/GDP-mannose dehydrogenase family protein [Clostridium sp.]
MKIAVAGTGYVGLVTGACLSHIGHDVTCVDVNEKKVKLMKSGISPIYEPGLDKILKEDCENGRLDFTTDYRNAYKDADVIFIGVGTPEKYDGSANLKYVYTAAKQIAQSVEKDCLVVVKSTVPIGTNDKIESYIKRNLKNNVNIELVSNPEFLSQGTAVKDTLHAKRIVIGTESQSAADIMKSVYEKFSQPIVVTNRRSAEMIKYASNDFLALKISFINEIANVCELVGANVEDVVKGMSYDPRIGNKFLKAGIGYGGSCFPKDTKALHWLAEDNGYEIKTIKATIEVNQNQKFKLIKKARKRFEIFEGLKVAALGLTFKPGTDDLREAPSIPNVKMLLEEGADIYAYDPVGMDNFRKIFPEQVCYVNSPEEALKSADVAFIFTEWKEIVNIKPGKFKELMKTPVIYDGRNCYNVDTFKDMGIEYYSIGR